VKTIAAGKFKAQCLEIIEYVRTTGEEVLITKRGKPLAKLVPVRKTFEDFTIVRDIESPVIAWDKLD
jgi:prevent-host-death family protein